MNIVLWIVQILLALHTVVGAVWKFSNAEQAVPSLKAIPHGAWMAMSVLEILCAVALVLPLLSRQTALLAPLAASVIAVEMLAFVGLHMKSGDPSSGPMIYWLVVAAVCAFVVFGRFSLAPL